MSKSAVDTLEKTLVPRLIWTGGLTSLDNSEAPGVQCFKVDEALLFLKINRNPKIFLKTGKGLPPHLQKHLYYYFKASLDS